MDNNVGLPCFESNYEEENTDEENEEDWSSVCENPSKRRSGSHYVSGATNSPLKKKQKTQLFETFDGNASAHANDNSSSDILNSTKDHKRTIVHIDIDCFYAQVEMIHNPSLSNKPLGIQQKHIIVTCNYVAREQGLKKLMRLSEAKKQCPDLVIINGEDLTKYREFSKRVNEILLGITPKIERLGFDENFLDVTSLVEARMKERSDDSSNLKPAGFVFGDTNINDEDKQCACGCLQRLTIGSHLAAEIRELIYEKTGLTCCAGIAHNKMLAKLAGECHKPNKQTVLIPADVKSFMQRLPARKIPGVGSSSAKRLQSIGITSVLELQSCPLESLQTEFGDGPFAVNLKRWSHGVDDTDVVPSGSPKSISEEDTYHDCSSIDEVTKHLQGLNAKLISRLTDDIGIPQTVRLTIRRGIGEMAGDRKESRQCPLPSKFLSPELSKTDMVEVLINSSLELFKKLVNIKQPFKIKLLNVCLTKFHKPTKNNRSSLSSFFSNCDKSKPGYITSPTLERCGDQRFETVSKPIDLSGKQSSKHTVDYNVKVFKPLPSSDKSNKVPFGIQQKAHSLAKTTFQQTLSSNTSISDNKLDDATIPSTIDKEVFCSLPPELRLELLQEWKHPSQERGNQKPAAPRTGLLKYFSKN